MYKCVSLTLPRPLFLQLRGTWNRLGSLWLEPLAPALPATTAHVLQTPKLLSSSSPNTPTTSGLWPYRLWPGLSHPKLDRPHQHPQLPSFPSFPPKQSLVQILSPLGSECSAVLLPVIPLLPFLCSQVICYIKIHLTLKGDIIF